MLRFSLVPLMLLLLLIAFSTTPLQAQVWDPFLQSVVKKQTAGAVGDGTGGAANLTTANRVVIVSSAGVVTQTSYLHTALVQGATSLTNVGAVSYVSAAGTLAEMSGVTWTNADRLLQWKDADTNKVVSINADLSGAGEGSYNAILSVNQDELSPASVASGTGTWGGMILLSSASGGPTTIATTGTGGKAGDLYLTSGQGGAASLATTASTGGNSGIVTLKSGYGGGADATGGTNIGGNSANVNISTGDGGAASNGSTNTGGAAGNVLVALGSGGVGATANGSDGSLLVQAGARANDAIFKVQSNAGAADFLVVDLSGDTVVSKALMTDGAAPTVGAGSCTGATIGTGAKMLAGTITGTPTATCTVTLTFPVTAPTGWSCAISNQTTGNLIRQSASTTTVATFVGVTVSGDVLRYGPCVAH